jgi:hypothetical protein
MLAAFSFTLFASATLLFLVEPMVGKMMLPLMGGTPAVWNTCMVFFQAILLAGYGYAHATTTWLGPRKQAAIHLAVLGLPLLFFLVNGPLRVNENLIVGHEGNPIPILLLVLTLSVGIPMFVVCTSAPLLQKWFADTDHPAARDPYFLYGASNLGSMLALLGYPAVVEPFFSLHGQRIYWAIGYALLAGLTALCAWFMWRSRPAAALVEVTPPAPEIKAAAFAPASEATTKHAKGRKKGESQAVTKAAPQPPSTPAQGPDPRELPVTGGRRLRWILLSLVPSSLMLGVTTYITTDIAAIPLLWVLPLALYLLTFIIVFAQISPRVQSYLTFGLLVGAAGAVAYFVPTVFEEPRQYDTLIWIIRLGCLPVLYFSLKILPLRDPHLLHKVMVMIMPLVVLLIIFMMLSRERPRHVTNIALHLLNLFVIAMVCHGELARDRPAPRYLTEYFLLMSVGGVLGGLFNALAAPLLFSGIIEYDLAMMVACLLVPPLGAAKESPLSRYADIGLAVLFASTGALLLILKARDGFPDVTVPANERNWALAAIAGALLLGLVAARARWGAPPGEDGKPVPDTWVDRLLDVVLPLSLGLLVVGLYWGLSAKGVRGRLAGFSEMINLKPARFVKILTYGLPAVLCYTFVERSVRFGLGVGALLLAATFSLLVRDPPLFQDRSFFGVLKVKGDYNYRDGVRYYYRELMHGTTLHGMQYYRAATVLEDGKEAPFSEEALRELRQTPLTYYHRTGPIGMVMEAYNTDPKRPVGLIGLGTGTMACYGLPGQTMTFYDIDPVVRDISFNTDRYFTYVKDAEKRGVKLDLILGDARLTLARNDLQGDEKYSVLVVDAFSSDAIPIHLITREALAMYLTKVREDGIICFHISNRYLDLEPVLGALAEDLGLVGMTMSDSAPDDDPTVPLGKSASTWVALARKPKYLDRLRAVDRARTENNKDWTATQKKLLRLVAWPDYGSGLSAQAALLHGVLEVCLMGRTGSWTKLHRQEDYRKAIEKYHEEIASLEKDLAALGAGSEADLTTADEARALRNKVASNKRRARRLEHDARVRPWTDDYSNILSVFMPFYPD